jgi:hypothetical protein
MDLLARPGIGKDRKKQETSVGCFGIHLRMAQIMNNDACKGPHTPYCKMHYNVLFLSNGAA